MLFFFFSSRRRHTRFDCDWSSDVCSSDLSRSSASARARGTRTCCCSRHCGSAARASRTCRSEEHTSELQSQSNLVCRLLLEKKKSTLYTYHDQGKCTIPLLCYVDMTLVVL